MREGGSPLLERHRMERAQAAAVDRALADNPGGVHPRQPVAKAEPGDLRGIPVLARGVGGAVRGSTAAAAIDRAHRDAERRKVMVAWA